MKKNTDFVFVTLVYRNYVDLYEFCDSLRKNIIDNYEVVVVDAFYNQETSLKIRECAGKLNCYYLQVKNEGYGYGNNRGIDYAKKMFNYKYIGICNPDTILKSKLSLEILKDAAVIAPNIIARNRKRQNPYWFCENEISEYLIYRGYQNGSKLFLYMGIGINKIIRDFSNIFTSYSKKTMIPIYACHGSFFIISSQFLEKSGFRYDENIFLFYEEACLAKEVRKNKYRIFYFPNIIVKHKEDGSMNLANIKEYPHLKKSYMYYYEKYRKQ